jgi:raffinose/stachyose/melibiose transport system substrate-binding protein
MTFSRVVNSVGILMITLAFTWSAYRVMSRQHTLLDDNKVVISFAHWQLESGLREAFDELARQYMELHPNVEVRQIAVPGRVYPTWLRTGYVGETLPDLVSQANLPDEILTAYYQPITGAVNEPNPYNDGTPLEGILWRDTFLDGLANSSGLETLQDYYSVPNAVLTVRMYYNIPLWEKILGDEPLPTNFESFMAVCEKVQAYAETHRLPLIPFAGSRFTANVIFDILFRSQTQKRLLELDRERDLQLPNSPAAVTFVTGLTDLNDPSIRDGLALLREVGLLMQPGFLQLDRDDAILMFAQGRALMIPTGAWDYGSIIEQSEFPVGVFPIPLPSPEHPRYGRNVLGPVSEAGGRLATNFHVSANSKHPEVAIDFLRFITSYHGNQVFANISKWPPGVIGVKPAPETTGFAPIEEGYTNGFIISTIMWGSGDVYRVFSQNIQRLVNPSGSVDIFVDAIEPDFDRAARTDVERHIARQSGNIIRQETMIGAMTWLIEEEADDVLNLRRSGAMQNQNIQEAMLAWLQYALNEPTTPSGTAP